MLIIGHRGVASLEPENTIRSFKKAVELGVDMIELDVRLSANGQIVVIHDGNLKRLFEVDSDVSELTVQELKELSGPQREIPTLAEVLAEISAPVNIHVKVPEMEKQLIDTLKKFPHKILISSVFPKILKKIRILEGSIQLGLIIGKSELHLMFILNWLVRDLNLYSIHPKNILISFGSIPIFKWHNRKVIIWDVNTQKDFQRAADLGADGVITDYPQLFVNQQ